jgi:hypothetical protein
VNGLILSVFLPTRTSRNQKDNFQLIEEPSGFGFISWVFLSVGKSLCFFCKDLTCNRLITKEKQMAAITQIKATIHTGDRDGAGTDGTVYLGICGREFKLARADVDDFGQASHRDYFLGNGANVEQANRNDPKSPQLDTTDADRFPAYIRLEPTGDSPDWDLDGVEVTITPGGAKYVRLGEGGGSHLWLGQNYGKFCYLRKV